MANEEHLKILKQGVEAWNEWREKNPQRTPDLSKANLIESDLNGANLYGADLSKANLIVANPTGANLTGANLSKANLIEADLTVANLTGADLTVANLTGANLYGANLTGAQDLTAKQLITQLAGKRPFSIPLSEWRLKNLSGSRKIDRRKNRLSPLHTSVKVCTFPLLFSRAFF